MEILKKCKFYGMKKKLYVECGIKLYSKYIVLFAVIACFLIYLWIDFSIGEKTVYHIFLYLGFVSKDDKFISSILNSVVNWVALLIPISVTFYFFVYREQKNISESSLNLDANPYIHFLFVAVPTMLIGWHLNNLIVDVYSVRFDNTAKYFGKILFFTGILIGLFIGGYKLIGYFFYCTNITKLLTRIITKLTKNINLWIKIIKYLPENKNYQKCFCQKINSAIEGIYQLLLQTINKDMTDIYQENYNIWIDIIKRLFSDTYAGETKADKPIRDNRMNIFLLINDCHHYCLLYNVMLKNQLSLIITLYKKNRIQEGYKAICDLFSFSPMDDIYYHEIVDKTKRETIKKQYDILMINYLATLGELAFFLYNNDYSIYPVIENIKSIPAYQSGITNIICVLRLLIIKVIEKDNMNILTYLVYSLMKTTNNYSPNSFDSIVLKSALTQWMENILSKSLGKFINKGINKFDKNQGQGVYVLLNAGLKAIELSHYACAGFIIKYLVSNVPSDILNKTYDEFIVNKGIDVKLDNHELGNQLGIFSFNINERTVGYCMEKLTILLYGQQMFIKENNLQVNYIPEQYITIRDKIQSYNIDYLFQKFKAQKDEYGLIYLQNDDFIEILKKQIRWNICIK